MLEIYAKLIPIIVISFWILYESHFTSFSISPLGKILAIGIIIYFTILDTVYGLLACAFVIIYYQSNYFNKIWSTNTSVNIQSTLRPLKYYSLPYTEAFNNTNTNVNDSIQSFKTQNCKNEELVYKGMKVKPEMSEHVFPEIHFTNEKCNPCSPTCEFSIIEQQLKASEEIKPKSSYEWDGIINTINNFIPSLRLKSDKYSIL
jgi:hypothetical protein